MQIDEQIDALVKEIRSNSCAEDEDDAMKRRAACEELADILTLYLPHTTVELFGSSANGKFISSD